MNTPKLYLQLLTLLCVLALRGYSQDASKSISPVSDHFFSQVAHKSEKFESRLNRSTTKALNKMLRRETKLRKKLLQSDTAAAKRIFDHSIDSLGALRNNLRGKTGKYTSTLPGATYYGYLNTLQGSLKFLNGANGSVATARRAGQSLQKVQQLQAQLGYADQVKSYLRQRRQQLKQQLSAYPGLGRDLQSISKTAYYYGAQIKEYKAAFQDHKKAEVKAMEMLKQLPAYNDFLKKHSQLAGLFNLSANENPAQSLEGLQTRSQVEELIQQRMGGGGPNAQAAVSEQLSQARERFNELKDKFPDADNVADMPDFTPNEMKSKSFLQRLEFGSNLQFQRSSQYFPGTSDIAGQVAYKFHKNGSAGIGTAYKLGMGTGFNNIRFSHQGVGLRSFLDWKLKGTFYVNGGFEQNYNSQLLHQEQLRNFDNWQGSALIGISKKYKVSSKLKGNIILLYDFLHNQHVPRTEPIKLRLGYVWR